MTRTTWWTAPSSCTSSGPTTPPLPPYVHPTHHSHTSLSPSVSLPLLLLQADEEDDENYLVDHSIVLYLIGPEGSFLDFFTQSMQPTDIVNRIKGYLGQARRVAA